MKRIIWLFLIIIVVYVNCNYNKEPNHLQETDHAEELQTLPGLDHGLIQSPVNILTLKAAGSGMHEIGVTTSDSTVANDVVNTGHSVKLDFNTGTVIRFDGKDYRFLQAHFHTPSEHQVDGIIYPMEIHFVCMVDLPKNQGDPEYLVAGAFFKMGEENEFIHKFLNRIPEIEHDTTFLQNNPVYIDDLLTPEEPFNDYYFYNGSLTTPPYTETVKWVIMKRILESSPEQIQKINALEGNNARHVQALFSREIENN